MKPIPLKNGDTITIAAPAGPFDRGRFLRGVSLLKKAGFRVTYGRDIFSKKGASPKGDSPKGYLAGDDARRARELNRALADPKAGALLFARGGYGCQRILPILRNRCSPKVVVGSSDLTVLLIYLWKRFRMRSYYGPMVAPHLILPKNVERLRQALTDPLFHENQKLVARKVLRPGRASGRLVGGCLSLLISTLGTPWEIDTDGALLFLEDTHEEAYAVDRMLTQLEQAGKLKKVRGIVLGTFRQKKILFPASVEAVFREKFKRFRGSVLWGIRFGHCPDPLLIPFGGEGRIEGKRLILTRGIF